MCHKCTGLCCRYFALPIETPEDWGDYDDIRWYLSHNDVSVFVEKGDWYLNIKNNCRYLSPQHRCDNYQMRPKICRKYKTDDCDLSGDEYDHSLSFADDRQMEEYMRTKFGPKIFDKLKASDRRAKKAGRKKAK
jgi:Fe-S-cluster containining protein